MASGVCGRVDVPGAGHRRQWSQGARVLRRSTRFAPSPVRSFELRCEAGHVLYGTVYYTSVWARKWFMCRTVYSSMIFSQTAACVQGRGLLCGLVKFELVCSRLAVASLAPLRRHWSPRGSRLQTLGSSHWPVRKGRSRSAWTASCWRWRCVPPWAARRGWPEGCGPPTRRARPCRCK